MTNKQLRFSDKKRRLVKKRTVLKHPAYLSLSFPLSVLKICIVEYPAFAS